MKLGFIGFGEVGFEMAMGFKSEGLDRVLAYDVMQGDSVYGPLIRERVQNSGVALISSPEEVIKNVDVIIVAVPGSKTLQTAKDIVGFFDEHKLYVDVSASAPETKRAVWETVKTSGAKFVDAAMLGSLPQYKHKVPTLISGNGSDELLRLMTPYGMALDKANDNPGDATAIKLVRSIVMKGLPALLMEALEAASAMKIEEVVLKSLAETMNSCTFEVTMNRLVTGTAVHAERRGQEMVNVIEMLNTLNIKPTMSQATFERHKWLAGKNLKEKFGGKTPKSWQEVVEAWGDKG